MKLAFIYGLWSTAQHCFDFDQIWEKVYAAETQVPPLPSLPCLALPCTA